MVPALALIAACLVPGLRVAESVVDGKRVAVLSADLGDYSIGVVTANGFPFGDEEFASMVQRAKPDAAINGAYFDVKTKKPIGDIVIDGAVRLQGRMGAALAVSRNGRVDILRVKLHRTMDWGGYATVLACGPALVLDGSIDVDPYREGFTEAKIFQPHARMGVGVSETRIWLIHVITPVTFEEFARVAASLGCREAMNLDAGASLAMFVEGEYIRKPGRRLTNLLTLTRRR
jgi:exopolysaccharide biosynthesis protein